jgi:hypothetical protein
MKMPAENRNTIPRSASELSRARRWRRSCVWGLSLAWTTSFLLLATAFIWTFCDGRSRDALSFVQSAVSGAPVDSSLGSSDVGWLRPRSLAVAGGITVVVGTTLLIAAGLLRGPRKFRGMSAWLSFLTLASGWLGYAVGWQDVYWRGQQWRLKPILADAESLARHLEANWPTEDGDLPQVGPYLAYPKGGPTTILPLHWITFPNTSLRFSAIERTADGAIRFELAGSEAGAWLEWRADDRAPMPFKSGLDMHYNVGRQQRLVPRWFLVRYGVGQGV